jgi:aerotaxis receptor
VESRLAQAAGIPERPDATGRLAGMLDAVRGIDVELRRWASGLDDLQAVASQLLLAAPQLRETMQRNQQVAELIRDGEDGERFASAWVYLRVWADMAPEVGTLVGDLLAQLGDLRRSCAETRFRIALAVLHNTTVGQFVVELVDGLPGADEAGPAIGDLCQALQEGMVLTQQRADLNVRLAAAAADQIASIRDLLELPQTMIRQWLAKADRAAASFAQVADAVSAQVERTQADIDLLAELAAQCRRIAVPLDVTVVEALLAVLAGLAGPEAPGASAT